MSLFFRNFDVAILRASSVRCRSVKTHIRDHPFKNKFGFMRIWKNNKYWILVNKPDNQGVLQETISY